MRLCTLVGERTWNLNLSYMFNQHSACKALQKVLKQRRHSLCVQKTQNIVSEIEVNS